MPRDDKANGARAKTRMAKTLPVSAPLVRLYSDYMHAEYGRPCSNREDSSPWICSADPRFRRQLASSQDWVQGDRAYSEGGHHFYQLLLTMTPPST